MRAEISRRTLLQFAAAGSAATVPAVATAAPDRDFSDLARPSRGLQQLVEQHRAVAGARAGLKRAMDLVWERGDRVNEPQAAHDVWYEASGALAIEQEDDRLYTVEWEIETAICNFTCAGPADALTKLDFTRRHLMTDDMDWSTQHAAMLRSMFGLLATGGEG